MRLLWVSNGHGEDTIGAMLVKTFQQQEPSFQHTVLPLVGLGRPYRSLPEVEVLEPTRELPSGGFSGRSPGFLWQDIKAGLLSLIGEQKRVLRQQDQDAAVAVGDIYALYLTVRAPVRPIIFLPTAKSDHISPHMKWEISYMKKHAAKVLARDAKTAEALRQAGVPAQYVGNPMMDAIQPKGVDFQLPPGITVAILPGSRREARANTPLLLEAARVLTDSLPERANFLFSRAPGIKLEDLLADLPPTWQILPGEGPVEAKLSAGKTQVHVSTYFSDIITQCQLVFGMAGTANEQAAGLGKPIVTCPGTGPQFTERFVRSQVRLLGGAVVSVERDPNALAEEAKAILQDKERYEFMAAQGRARMGERGATGRMVEIIAQIARAGTGPSMTNF